MMAFSKFYAPKKWTEVHHGIVNESTDPDLFSEDEFFAWVVELELCHDRSVVTKYVNSIRTYNFMRHNAPTLPKNELNNQLFKLWEYMVLSFFMSDDQVETFTRNERIQICDAYHVMQDEIGKNFPRWLSIPEMQHFLSQKNFPKYLVPHALYHVSFTNDVVKAMLEFGDFQLKDVKDYWNRLVAAAGLFPEGVGLETTVATSNEFSRIIWVRLGSIGIVIYGMFHEVACGAVGSMAAHLSLLNQLIFIQAIIASIFNDIYSYHKEESYEYVSNIVERLLVSKNLPGVPKAMTETVKILNAYVKVLYKIIEKAKEDNPDNKLLWEVMENIGVASAGYYFYHESSCPRYVESPWRVSLDEVEEDCVKEWRRWNEEKEMEEVMVCLFDSSPITKRISDNVINSVRPSLLKCLN